MISNFEAHRARGAYAVGVSVSPWSNPIKRGVRVALLLAFWIVRVDVEWGTGGN